MSSSACTVPTCVATKVMTHRRDDPDDLLQRRVEREQRRELPRVDHLRVDRAHGRLDRRRGEAGDERRAPCRPGSDVSTSASAVIASAQITQRRGEHPAHAPDAHPAARDRAGDGLADRRRGQHQPGGAVRAGDVLDVQQDREARHAVGEARRQLGGDDARDARRAQKIPVARHPTTLSARRTHRPARRTSRHAATRRDTPKIAFHRQIGCRSPAVRSHLWTDAAAASETGVIQGFSRFANRTALLWMKRWTTCVVSWGERWKTTRM